jgi:hypothetical protein
MKGSGIHFLHFSAAWTITDQYGEKNVKNECLTLTVVGRAWLYTKLLSTG